ncbi:MAG: hypothetical protein A2418_00160 [Candidatus Brennerbacteria bacterium RIFOXYC1_FULL_41_11]|uniref:Uncharacterized protein n=1 Tax=Candidatus Brennerbacteria bacterium RIFOXYD1_FULL_41_16 TaxID=1797529 RepID=A0A1G1XK52_9BACT|nr:MAG: hypothetical protein A2391_01620 [Candidatus Brennerbacteria bacterium RIFOXYB1_FULL_41_13]OGY39870.1 MAG: hypothetical protein A2418_00160 [Candidatus Brennerbacteria bacterium RIFOXYC1_FULL_41_11]OGY40274.1 MAG: hypothetical protein A2570_03285 [Candidatus Brennerbacteria bacterium RIFOXYD1_FULL_41_16]
MFVLKAGGKKEYFNKKNIERSLAAIGLDAKIAKGLSDEVSLRFKKSVSSDEIFRFVISRLKSYGPEFLGRYNLRRAVMNLGPTGYPFERYVAKVLEEYGYRTKTNQIVQGHCVKHEIDVMAWKDKTHLIVECKYHNTHGARSDLKVALYVWSRFLDIKKKWEEDPGHKQAEFHGVWLMTNTRFTSEAVQYGECVGMLLTGWGYPREMSLEKMIHDKKLYPIDIFPDWNGKLNYHKLYESEISLLRDCLNFSAKEFSKKSGLKEVEAAIFQSEALRLIGN